MRIFIAVATLSARFLYAVLKAVVPAGDKVVFLSRQSDTPSRDFVMLADALCSAEPGIEIVTRCRRLGSGVSARIADVFAMIGQMYHLAGARACVVDGYVIPVSLLEHRRGLFVVQMWHALGAVKKFGYQTVGRPGGRAADIADAMRMHRNYDLVLCGGPATVPVFAEAFGVDPGIVRPLGLPRIDYLLDAKAALRAGAPSPEVAAVLRSFPVLADADKVTVLYAPTYRKGGSGRYQDVTARFSGERYTLIVKPHPLETARIEGPNVVDATGIDILDLLPLCSAVITDYSAVAFEAAVIGVPVYFFVYDIDDYARDNGLNIDPLDRLPQASARDVDDLATLIEAGVTHPELTRMLAEGYASAPRGCAERIARTIIDTTRTH